MDNKRALNYNIFIVLFCFVCSIAVLLICTKCSPLYLLNDWPDASVLFMDGRKMLHGGVLYRDVYEHKGLYYCLMHMFGAFISEKCFIGIYIYEVFSFTVFLFLVYKIWRLYLDEKSMIFIPIYAAAVVGSMSFCQGDSAEEFCLPFFTCSLYMLLRFIRSENFDVKANKTLWFIQGVFTAIVFWTKYVHCFYYVGWCVFIAYFYLKRKEIFSIIKIALYWFLGMVVASIPAIVYFTVNDAWKDLWQVYGYNLIFSYSSKEVPALDLIVFFLLTLFVFAVFIIGGIIGIKFKLLKGDEKKAFRFLMIGTIAVYILMFKHKEQYVLFLFMPVFSIWFMNYIFLVEEIAKKTKIESMIKKVILPISLGVLIICTISLYFTSYNARWIGKGKSDYIYYEYADIINKEKNPTLLMYKTYDSGFYFATGIVPKFKYITNYNIELDDMITENDRIVENKEAMFIITVDNKPEIVKNNYDLVADKKFKYYAIEEEYYLWKRK